MKIDLKNIEELAENLEKYNLTEVHLESNGVKVKIKKEKSEKMETAKIEKTQRNISHMENIPTQSNMSETSGEYETIDAPMVGTFYKAPSPDSESFVTLGKDVSVGDVLCILEAMKLMNEVKAPKNCKIMKILVEDGQIVKKGDKLFAIE